MRAVKRLWVVSPSSAQSTAAKMSCPNALDSGIWWGYRTGCTCIEQFSCQYVVAL